MPVLILLFVSVVWGSTFVVQKMAMSSIGPLAYTAIRFALGGLVLLPLAIRIHSKRKLAGDFKPGEYKTTVAAITAAGVALFGGAALQQAGMVYTSAGKAGFITGLYVVIVPLYLVINRRKVSRGEIAGALAATAGLYLLTVRESLTVMQGDELVLASAFVWAAHLLILARFSPRVETFAFASGQFLVCSFLSLIASLVFENTTVEMVRLSTPAILYGGLLSVGIAYTLQIFAQKRAPATVAAVVLSLETLFAAVFGMIFLGERMGNRELAGAALMFAGMMLAQFGARRSKK